MSNGEVKRWWIKNEDGLVDVFNVRKHVLDYKPEGFDEKTPLGPRYIEVMRVEDHERVVAGKDAEIERLELVAMAAAESIKEKYKILDTQKRVIEKLTEQRNRAADRHHKQSLNKYLERIAKFEAEITAIEKAGAKDE